MEIAFHANKCALKDTLRVIKRARNPCWKRRRELLAYSESLIGTNHTIISLHGDIPESDQQEFFRLIELFQASASATVAEDAVCFICMKNCLDDPGSPGSVEELSGDDVAAFPEQADANQPDVNQPGLKHPGLNQLDTSHPGDNPPPTTEKTAAIGAVAQKLDKLNSAANFLDSLVTLQSEGINQSSFDAAFATGYSQSNLQELEEILQRKQRQLMFRRWAGAVLIFLCFLSLLLIKPLFPTT